MQYALLAYGRSNTLQDAAAPINDATAAVVSSIGAVDSRNVFERP